MMLKHYYYWLLQLEWIYSLPSYRLYNTELSDRKTLEYDCLNYYILDNIIYSKTSRLLDHQIIPYCIRPLSNQIEPNETKGPGTSITFEKLRQLNLSSEDLLQWSAPISLAEKYQLYLDETSHAFLFNETFFNCSYGWFGLHCEYTFFLDVSFGEIVRHTFLSKIQTIPLALGSITNHTCYMHLRCDRGPHPICLDWREICNGHIDCLNDGVDEENCFQLEANECNEDEYRCLNGQCIPKSFFRDYQENPDCLDRSDEKYSTSPTAGCPLDPSFRCEETTCTYSSEFACGDGECRTALHRWPRSSERACNNLRKYLFDRTIFSFQENSQLRYECWSAMICLLDLAFLFENIECAYICQFSREICLGQIRRFCPQEFLLPSYPIFVGHVYSAFQSSALHQTAPLTPDYLCFNQTLCPFFPASIRIQNQTCQPSTYFDTNPMINLDYIFLSCLSNFQARNRTYCEQSNMYQCSNTHKCISKHRLVDNILDCYAGDDESFNSSCSLNHTYRFQCSSQLEKCISPLNVEDLKINCPNWEDEKFISTTSNTERIPFPMLCDGFWDLNVISADENNETDETHCEYWPCVNQYTRCDGISNCVDNADELNCESSLCSGNFHPCISLTTFKLSCLPMTLYGNGMIECLGGTDEQHYCRQSNGFSRLNYFQCQNSSICLRYQKVCDQSIDCLNSKEDEKFCRNTTAFMLEHICSDALRGFRTIEEEFLCSKLTKSPAINYFQLENSTIKSHSNTTLNSFQSQELSPRNIGEDLRRQWLCNRGVLLYRGFEEEEELCICPPSYYGSRCQYQNERVSLTIQIRTGQARVQFELVIQLIDNQNETHSFEQRQFLAMRDCRFKFHLNLLYRTRPKAIHNRTYSVRIDIFHKSTLKHHSAWLFPLQFLFLPVQRLAVQLVIEENPIDLEKNCPLNCQHGQCRQYRNHMSYFCQCHPFYFGALCTEKQHCQCSSDSLCMTSFNNRSICICPPFKYGPQCRLTHRSCPRANPCRNGGTCIPTDERISEKNFTCICDQTHSGPFCERNESQIIISFEKNFPIPSFIIVHFITVQTQSNPIQAAYLIKIGFAQDTALLYRSELFHIIITQISTLYYLTLIQNDFLLSSNYSATIFASNRCPPVDQLFNQSILQLPFLHRVKYYHLPCLEQVELQCFYDDMYLCLCNSYRHANCFEFDRHIDFNCNGLKYCRNNGSCFQNHPVCPSTVICSCPECYHGPQCQLNTHTFLLSLDVILGYHIHPQISFSQQPLPIQISVTLLILLTIVGLISSILSIITFRSKTLQKVGCGIYLYICSIDCLLLVLLLNVKFWFLVLFQMNLISNPTVLLLNCILIELLLKTFFSLIDWLNVCVSIERVISIIKGVQFNKIRSRTSAKYVIITLSLFIPLSYLHDPVHRQLLSDDEENRIWCFVSYDPIWFSYNSVINIIHVAIPFLINIVSAFLIILFISRQRTRAQKRQSFREHFREQFRQHRHLIISPLILIVLVMPRLIISFLPGCIKSARDPWLYLIGYFLSFISPVLVFIIFVLPSDVFRKEFIQKMSVYCHYVKRRS